MSSRTLLVVIVIFTVAMTAGTVVMAYRGLHVSERVNYLWLATYSLLVVLWFREDSHVHGVHLPLDAGFFVIVLWPLVIPYHCYKSRGLKGLALAAGLLAGYCLPHLFGALVYFYA